MQIGMIGLGRMGANMARRLMRGAHECVVYDRNAETVDTLKKEGATGASSLEEVVEKLKARALSGSCFHQVRPRKKRSLRFPNY